MASASQHQRKARSKKKKAELLHESFKNFRKDKKRNLQKEKKKNSPN